MIWYERNRLQSARVTRAKGMTVSITIAEVAGEAGVSRSTVSRAFTAPDLVSSATRARVLAAARRLGYQTNRTARALAVGRCGAIGLVVPDIANPFFPPIIKGVQARVRRRDGAAFVADTDERAADELDVCRAMSGQVDGLILASSRMPEDRLREVARLVPVVLVNRQVDGIPAVLIDNADGTTQAVEHLHALGHRHVCYLSGPRDSWSNGQRAAAIGQACQSMGIELVELGPFDATFEAGIRSGDLVVASGATGVVAYDDVIALGLISRLAERGIRVGADLSVIGFDDSPMARTTVPALSSVQTPGAEAGIAAVDMLLELIDREAAAAAPAPLVQLETRLVVRATTHAVRDARVPHRTRAG